MVHQDRQYSALIVERRAVDHRSTRALFARHNKTPIVEVDSYREVFNRNSQSYLAQKRHAALIIGMAGEPFLHEATDRIDAGDGGVVCYTDQLRNCVYECDYCFLQGMHRSGHTLVFVNEEEYHDAARRRARDAPLWLNISFLSDILAFEGQLPLVAGWIRCADETENLTVEIRTKSCGPAVAGSLPVKDSSVFTWTLSPEKIVQRYEARTAPLADRLSAAGHAAETGRRIRLAFDPVLLVDDWRTLYGDLIDHTFRVLPADAVEAASYGVFRMATDHLDRIRRIRSDSSILYHPFSRAGGVATYSPDEVAAIDSFIGERLSRYLAEEQVVFVHG